MARKRDTRGTSKKAAKKSRRKARARKSATSKKAAARRSTRRKVRAPKSIQTKRTAVTSRPKRRSTTRQAARQKVVQPRPRPWKQAFATFVREWRAKHQPQPGTGERLRKMARTFLRITRTADTHVQLQGLGQKHVPVIISNLGSVAAYTCVVRMFEARPRNPIHEKIPLPEFKHGGQSIFTLQPGEKKTVRVPFQRTIANGTFIAIVSDPLLDPNELTVADPNHRRLLLVNLV
jgi:hypothetical protein